jgi:hypothetical protein
MGDEMKPWEIGRSIDMSAPIGPPHLVSSFGNSTRGAIRPKINVTKQTRTPPA